MTENINAAKMKAFEEALARINKSKGILSSETGQLIAKLSDRPRNVETISTGSLVLDGILGGGLAKGRIIEIFGKESSGKTSIALTAVANVQRQGGIAVFIDLENALDPSYAKKLGVNIEDLAVSQPDYAEQALELVQQLTETGAADIIVVDSVAALVPKLELEGDMDQNSIGLVARLMSRALKKLVGAANRTGTTIILINQTRVAIGAYSPMGVPEDTTGGKALKFYSSQRISVNRAGQIKEGSEVIGNEVRLRVVKNKIAPPFGVGTTVMTFGEGINKAAELIVEGPKIGAITMPNNRTYIDSTTGEVFGKSRAEALENLQKDPALLKRLSDKVAELLKEGATAPVAASSEEDEPSED